MIYVIKTHMKTGKHYSQDLLEIDSLYLEGLDKPGFYKKEDIYDYLKSYPNSIQVKVYPYPNVIPAVSVNGEKYVKSSPDRFNKDNLLSLPRE